MTTSSVRESMEYPYPNIHEPHLRPDQLAAIGVDDRVPLPDKKGHLYDSSEVYDHDDTTLLARPRISKFIQDEDLVRYRATNGRYAQGPIDVRSVSRQWRGPGEHLVHTYADTFRGTWELHYLPSMNQKRLVIAKAIGLRHAIVAGDIFVDTLVDITLQEQYSDESARCLAATRGLLAIVGDVSMSRSYDAGYAHSYTDQNGMKFTPEARLNVIYGVERPYGYGENDLVPGQMTILEGEVTGVRQSGNSQALKIDTGKEVVHVSTDRLRFKQAQINNPQERVPEYDRQPRLGDLLQLRAFMQSNGELTVGTSTNSHIASNDKSIRTAYYLNQVD